MRIPLLSSLLAKARPRPPAPPDDGKPVLTKGWTTPKTAIEILARNIRTEKDWVIGPNAVQRRGFQVTWKRTINGSYRGIRLTIDGKNHPLTGDEASLLSRAVRDLLASAAPETAPDPAPSPSVGES